MTYSELPAGYSLKKTINLRKGKPYAFWAALLNLVLCVLSLYALHFLVPVTALFEEKGGDYILTLPRLLLDLVWIFVGLLIYAVAHLVLKGLFLKALGGMKPKFGIKGFYYYVGSRAYFSRGRYVLLILLPELVVEALLILLLLLLPPVCFWPLAFVHAFHISRIGTSLLLTILLLREPNTALFRNMGTLSAVFSK